MGIDDQARKRWEEMTKKKLSGRSNGSGKFYQCSYVNRFLNRKICGKPLAGPSAGLHRAIWDATKERPIKRAISVGCGAGQKEMELLSSGTVEHFTLVDIVPLRKERSAEISARRGLSGRIDFRIGNAFEIIKGSETFDLVYWDTALHHMPDAGLAIEWSRERLAAGGIFAMQEYIGPSRFQYSDDMLELVDSFRSHLPDRLLINEKIGKSLPRKISRRSVRKMVDLDPSEACDSVNILPSIANAFPGADVRLLGGAIYSLGLDGVYRNICQDDEDGRMLLDFALLLDEQAGQSGHNLRASLVHIVE